jgi:hypothetical protein
VTAIATTQRPKLDVLRAKEADLAIEVDAARARIAEYPELLHDARSRAVYAKPNVRPGSELNGEVAKITAGERKDLAALNGLEGDLSAVRSVIAVEAERVAEEETAEARAQLAELHEKEEMTWKRAGKLLGDLASVWNAYVDLAEEEDRFATANGLEGSGVLAVEPTPATFKAFLLLLHQASTDETVRSEPHTEQLVDSGIYGRRDEHGNAFLDKDGRDIGGAIYDSRVVGTRTIETRHRLDARDVLFNVVPDLRSVVRALSLSGCVPKFTAE